ncbi:17687_t:CDS:10 [Acaulospora morrowiae]|uniref:17687_t:CDS:1 n=1 Tax=Acaulospora morrowiae TaxID=94023 RepID=A0A9N9CRA0_9GLOM|nr:17687_t:CDS:10 [Acaulospora morrowiae]
MNFYKQASDILEKLQNRKSSIKSLTLADDVKEKKKMYALICNTLKYKGVIDKIIDNSQLLVVEKKLPRNIATLLVHDLLFSPNGLKSLSDGPYKKSILKHEIRLKCELVKLKVKLKVKNNEDLINPELRNSETTVPRYIRVNTLKTTVEKVVEHFKAKKYKLEESNDDLGDISPQTIIKDKHLPELLILPPNTDLHNDPLYLSGDIILQDKASCFPSFICSPLIDSHVIDACAAPGNKTSHLSSIMQNSGKIWAFDIDKKRLELLKKLTRKAGCENIVAVHGSFLEENPLDSKYSNVECILLDPSCSGSGMVSRLAENTQDQLDSTQKPLVERLKNLSEFQERMILHAFKFPTVKKIVYSTCSIYAQENEHVVRRVLEQTSVFELADRKDVMPSWSRRGITSEMGDDEEAAEKLVRSIPNEDHTNGFFVACFVRKSVQCENNVRSKVDSMDNSIDDSFIAPPETKHSLKRKKRG